MKTILITAIGGDIAQAVALILHRSGRPYRLLGTDLAAQHGGELFVDRVFGVPAASQADYTQCMLEIVARESVDVVIPLSEPELGAWAAAPELMDGAHWLMPNQRIVEFCLDKLETMYCLMDLGLPVPWTRTVDAGPPPALPCILKDRFGSGSKNVQRLNNDEDVRYFSTKYPAAIYQELLLPEEQELTCAVYRSADARIAVLQMRRKLSGGLTGWFETVDEPEVATLCRSIAEGLDLQGSINVQLRLTPDGPRVFEINPRFSSTVLMRHLLGFSDLIWSLDELDGKPVEFPRIPAGEKVARTHDAQKLGPERSKA